MFRDKIKIPKLKEILEPTIDELVDFSSNFTKKEWEKLCFSRVFLNNILEDLNIAKEEAYKILELKS